MPRGRQGPDTDEMERLRRAKEALAGRIDRIPGAHSIGIGYKRVGGKRTDKMAVIIYVDEKLPRAEVEAEWLIPDEVRIRAESGREMAIPTDVVARSRPVEYPHIADGGLAGRVRPVPGGRSITRAGSGGGTLGGWVWDDVNDEVVLLTNRHVLGTVNGTDVFQPWSSTAAADRIADVVRAGSLDATIAAPTGTGVVEYQIAGVGPAVYEVAEATIGMQVEKSGATTEHTTGVVVAVDISSHSGGLYFEVDRDAGIDRFAYYGDSGSLIVERTHPQGRNWKRVVGLLWGGVPSDRNGFAHQMTDVFADLSLTTVCAGWLAAFFDALFARPEEMSLREPVLAAAGRPALPRAAAMRPPWLELSHRGLARAVERRLAGGKRGRAIADAVDEHRVAVVELLHDPDVRRALLAATLPLVADTWSVDELFERKLTEEDVKRFDRFFATLRKRRRDLDKPVKATKQLLASARGHSLAEVID